MPAQAFRSRSWKGHGSCMVGSAAIAPPALQLSVTSPEAVKVSPPPLSTAFVFLTMQSGDRLARKLRAT